MSTELRMAALHQAAHDLKGSAPSSDVVARAREYLDFLEGKRGVSTGLRAGSILAQNNHRRGPEYDDAVEEMAAAERVRGMSLRG